MHNKRWMMSTHGHDYMWKIINGNIASACNDNWMQDVYWHAGKGMSSIDQALNAYLDYQLFQTNNLFVLTIIFNQ